MRGRNKPGPDCPGPGIYELHPKGTGRWISDAMVDWLHGWLPQTPDGSDMVPLHIIVEALKTVGLGRKEPQ
jgi:hypothetical protein